MLKITVNDDGGVTTLKLEGKVSGEWVQELRSCWQQAKLSGEGGAVRVDLAGVTWVSNEGKALLGVMYRDGTELLQAFLLVADIVAEISEGFTEGSELS